MATVHFVRPRDGKRRSVSSRWRLWGVLFGFFAMLRAGLWLHALLMLLLSIALGYAAEWAMGLHEGDPDYILTYIPGWIAAAIYGGFIPRLRIRKYERLGWQRVEKP
ncbi:MAG: hypothetical protein EBR82_01925 [Caulobacteraceae bacterium]|nr:hypothetical protein [Caulobacteraceae bacterium]